MKNIQQIKLGILGGGQLGRMLAQKAFDFNIQLYVLDPDKDCSCKFLGNFLTIGNFRDFDTVYQFGKDKDLITIEIEDVNVDALKQLQKEGVQVFPKPEHIEMIKDKGLQKMFYKEHHLPTANFLWMDEPNWMNLENKIPFVQKLRVGGYDGKGVSVIKNQYDASKLMQGSSLIEELVDIEKEIAIMGARNEAGQIKLFPVVELVFNDEANLLDYLFSPANVSIEIELKAKEIAGKLLQEMQFVGLLAIEFFVTKKGEVLINEIAPRPHNSGHHTIEANYTSQYEQMLRAIFNLPLGNTEAIQAAVMYNVLGEKGYEGVAIAQGIEKLCEMPGAKLHLYGKTITKPFRKMGHITITAKSLQEAVDEMNELKKYFKIIA
jgi:5-(carboxyamino)imidazole ribonucleotide synthase